MKHTSEPWRVEDDGTFVEVMAGEKTVLPAIRKVEAAADFRRIVACVNACAGISDEALKSWMNPPDGGFGHPHGPWPAHIISLQRAAETLKQQRDGLRAALKDTRACLEAANNTPNGPIIDTIWCGPAETLFDFIDAELEKVGAGGTAPEGHNANVCGLPHGKEDK